LLAVLSGAAEITHDTQTDFAPGAFMQTVLAGSEMSPSISLEAQTVFDWTFSDDDIAGWQYQTNAGGVVVAQEDPEGQIHVSAQATSGETYAFAWRSDVEIPNAFSVEYTVRFDALQPSGVTDPFASQPTGAGLRLDIGRADTGLRVDVFSDRIVSFYREGNTGINYPTVANVDLHPPLDLLDGQWHVLRFDVDLAEPGQPASVVIDGDLVGTLAADARNGSTNPQIRIMAYSRTVGSGLVDVSVDRFRLGREAEEVVPSGTYTSAPLEIGAVGLGTLSWTSAPASVYPWGTWVKDPDNPIISSPALVENLLVDLDDPLMQPITYEHPDEGIGEVYWACYSPGGMGGTIELAYSEDADLDTWTKYGTILSPDAGENYVYSPNIFLDEGTYYLVYDVQLTADVKQRNAYATAPTPLGPWTKGRIILELGEPGAWDDLRVTEPFVFKEGDTYFMYYMGDHGAQNGDAEQVGLATTTADLFPLGPEPGGLWTKHGLVLPFSADPTAWDRGLTADPSIIKVGGIYYMRYTGSYANEHWQLGTAWATDLYGPWHRPDAPDIVLGPPGSWDDDRLVRGAIHFHDGRYYSPYTGNNGSAYAGGMATADALPSEDYLALETSTSADGINWEAWQPVTSGGAIASTPQQFFRYRASFTASPEGFSAQLFTVSLQYDDGSGSNIIAPIAPASDQVSCATTVPVDVTLALADGGAPIRGYTVTVQGSPELSFDADDITVYVVPAGETSQAYVTDIGTNAVEISYALLGDTPGIVADATIFTVSVTGAASGVGTLSLADGVVRDLENVSLPVIFDGTVDLIVDCDAPAAVADLTTAPRHEAVVLTWQDPDDADLVECEVWRARWHDGEGASAYPEYDDLASAVLPSRPTDRAAAAASADWSLIATVDPGIQQYTDTIAERGIYRYEVFGLDPGLNAGPPAEASRPSTNYILGDMALPYDGEVNLDDITRLANTFGESEDGESASYDNECDIGPTDNMSVRGLPTTDSLIDFEDLIIAAINFGVPAGARQESPGTGQVLLSWHEVEGGEWALKTVSEASLQGLELRCGASGGGLVQANLGSSLRGATGQWLLVGGDGRSRELAIVRVGDGAPIAPGSELLRIRTTEGVDPGDWPIQARDAVNGQLVVDFGTATAAPVPTAYALHPATPNPFNPRTEIRFDLPERQFVKLGIYDVSGRRVAGLVDQVFTAGQHAVTWNGTDQDGRSVSSGLYFYRIDAGAYSQVRKMTLMK
jgi:hypothetical protein